MIDYPQGNLLVADAEALVNTVNCVGYMGKGIALQFRQAFPENFASYEKACRAEQVVPGQMFIYETGAILNPRYIINFPTKRHWRSKSRIDDIQQGLNALVVDVKRLGIKSIAIPPLGCGLGGLDWKDIQPLILQAFSNLPDVHVSLYAPQAAPSANSMPIRTARPQLTPARALFIKLLDQYSALHYRRTLLEIQKLAYFLQESGEPLRLRFEKGLYGPYAHNLNKVLKVMEGHYIRGYGDSQKPDTEIALLPDAVAEADQFLEQYQESLHRLQKVNQLIAGFETPYGMELLASVHWVGKHGEPAAFNDVTAISSVQNWNPRKKQMFQARHIQVAWQQLQQLHWL